MPGDEIATINTVEEFEREINHVLNHMYDKPIQPVRQYTPMITVIYRAAYYNREVLSIFEPAEEKWKAAQITSIDYYTILNICYYIAVTTLLNNFVV